MLREVLSTELYTILLIVCVALVAITKLLFPKRFYDFSALLYKFRYLKVYSRDQKFFDLFEGLLFVNLIIGLSIFCMLCLNLNISVREEDYLLLGKLAIGIGVFFLIKILLERIISSILTLDFITENYIFQKVSYRNFLGLILIPINAILVYTLFPNKVTVSVFIILLLVINVTGILIFFKDNLRTIKKSWFYFILYLCTLEISPYLILYKLFT